jgi:hypothetical protein
MPAKRILLVEGVDDEHVIKHLCGTRGVGMLDEIKQQGSVRKLLDQFPVRLKESDLVALGLVVDADEEIAGRWEAIRDRLAKAGYLDLPRAPSAEGTVIDPPEGTLLPRVGVWIMPDNQQKGILEDYLRFLIPADGLELFHRVEKAVEEISPDLRRFTDLAKPKALIHTWLAWQEEPGKPMGTAITARFLDSSVPQVDVFIAWLKRLFFDNPTHQSPTSSLDFGS